MTPLGSRTGVERATLAEGRLAVPEERLAGVEARVLELPEQVSVLSRMLFGQSSEKAGPGKPGDRAGADGQGDSGQPGGSGQAGKRGQRPGSKGHGRRDYSGLETREEIHDVPAGQRACPVCGQAFEFLGSESSEQIDWQVKLTRIVHRRLRHRRRCQPGTGSRKS